MRNMTPERVISAAKEPVVTQAAIVVPRCFACETPRAAPIRAAFVAVLMVIDRETDYDARV